MKTDKEIAQEIAKHMAGRHIVAMTGCEKDICEMLERDGYLELADKNPEHYELTETEDGVTQKEIVIEKLEGLMRNVAALQVNNNIDTELMTDIQGRIAERNEKIAKVEYEIETCMKELKEVMRREYTDLCNKETKT